MFDGLFAESPAPAQPPAPDPLGEARQAEVIEQLRQVIEPTLGNTIVSLGMVRNLRIVGDYVYLRLYVGSHQLVLQEQVEQALAPLLWCKKTYVQMCTIPQVRITLAVASGKGGVGKSTSTVNLAAALTQAGARVGILDADIYGPNIPQMLGIPRSEVTVIQTDVGQRFQPLMGHGIQVMSVGLLADPEHPLAWRGPVLHKILTQFLHEVAWQDLDFLLIDLPPGTGDAQITIVQESPICGALVVTTPQQVALSDVRRSIQMFRKVGVPTLGLIENMSYLRCGHCGEPTPIFGQGGGRQLEQDLQIPLLGQVPLDPRICAGGDGGQPLTVADPQSETAEVFGRVAAGLIQTFAPRGAVEQLRTAVS